MSSVPIQRSIRAFSLIELVVVLGIIATLMALLLPALQRLRAAATRASCANNLRQIGIALHLYHNARGVLPPGVSSDQPNEPFPRLSWLARLLPHIEQEPLWRATTAAFDYQRRAFRNPPHLGLSYPISIYGCPADGRVAQPQTTHRGRRVALTSYLGRGRRAASGTGWCSYPTTITNAGSPPGLRAGWLIVCWGAWVWRYLR